MRRRFPWRSVLVMLTFTVLVPAALYTVLGRGSPGMLATVHLVVSTSFALTSALLLWETGLAYRRRRAPVGREALPAIELPHCTAVVAAYLPNEQDLILTTLEHLLHTVAVPADRLEVILAYNTPGTLPVEQALAHLAARDPRLRLLRVDGSRSKAENVNAALALARGAIVGVFDADHLPEAQCFQKAWRWLAQGYAAVQGRCVIRNATDNWLTRLIMIEFESLYAITHLGRSLLSDTAIFGGSNGYWRTDVLRALQMDPAMMTEDIDCSVRALLAGHHLVHDRSIVSEELAPVTFTSWWFQRKRWGQGWFQVSRKYWRALLATPHLSPGQKTLWAYTLLWLQVYPLLTQQVLPLILAAQVLRIPIGWFDNWYLVATTALTLACGPVLTFATYQRTLWRARARLRWWFPVYAAAQLPYTMLKNWVVLVAQHSEFAREDEWVVTQRPRPTPPLDPLERVSVGEGEPRRYPSPLA